MVLGALRIGLVRRLRIGLRFLDQLQRRHAAPHRIAGAA